MAARFSCRGMAVRKRSGVALIQLREILLRFGKHAQSTTAPPLRSF